MRDTVIINLVHFIFVLVNGRAVFGLVLSRTQELNAKNGTVCFYNSCEERNILISTNISPDAYETHHWRDCVEFFYQ